jgi:hypothetical protein
MTKALSSLTSSYRDLQFRICKVAEDAWSSMIVVASVKLAGRKAGVIALAPWVSADRISSGVQQIWLDDDDNTGTDTRDFLGGCGLYLVSKTTALRNCVSSPAESDLLIAGRIQLLSVPDVASDLLTAIERAAPRLAGAEVVLVEDVKDEVLAPDTHCPKPPMVVDRPSLLSSKFSIPDCTDADHMPNHLDVVKQLLVSSNTAQDQNGLIVLPPHVEAQTLIIFLNSLPNPIRDLASQHARISNFSFSAVFKSLRDQYCRRDNLQKIFKRKVASLSYQGSEKLEEFIVKAAEAILLCEGAHPGHDSEKADTISAVVGRLGEAVSFQVMMSVQMLAAVSPEDRWELSLPFMSPCGHSIASVIRNVVRAAETSKQTKKPISNSDIIFLADAAAATSKQTTPPSNHVSRNYDRTKTQCSRCEETGHFASECPTAEPKDMSSRCRKCGSKTHQANECRQICSKPCFRCGKTGHNAAICLSRMPRCSRRKGFCD